MIDILRNPYEVLLLNNKCKKITCSDAEVNYCVFGDSAKVTFSSKESAVAYVLLRWKGEFCSGTRLYGDAFERAYGNLEFRSIVPRRLMSWYCVETSTVGSAGYGVKVRPNALCYWAADNGGLTLWLDIRCGAVGFSTDGETLELAEVVSAKSNEGEPLFSFMQRFCRLMASNVILPKKPVYGFNNWYYAYGKSSEGEIIEDSRLLSSLTEGLENRPYMVIDDCWQRDRPLLGCTGTLGSKTNGKFPDMKRLADRMKAMGVIPGLWLRPLRHNRIPLLQTQSMQRLPTTADPSLPSVLERIAKDIEKVTGEWGYRLIKYDFSTSEIMRRFVRDTDNLIFAGSWKLKKKMTNAQAIKGFYKTIFDHSNGAVIIGCNCVGHLGCGYFHIHRSGDDTSGVNWERTCFYGLNTLAFRLHQHKAFFDIDADCVGITDKIDWKNNREWLRLLSMSGTPLFVSADPKALTEEIKADLRAALARASKQEDVCTPIDWLDTVSPCLYEINGEKVNFSFYDKAWSSDLQ